MSPFHTIIAALVFAHSFALASADEPIHYAIIDMGLLPNGGFSKAHAISDNGMVVGQASADLEEMIYAHSVLWVDGQLTDLTGLGISGSVALGVNDDGVVVGVTDEFSLSGFRWADGRLTQLPTLAPKTFSAARDIDVRGRIVGQSAIGLGTFPEAVIWDGASITPLGGGLGGLGSTAHAINEIGIIVGDAGVPGGVSHAFLHDGHSMFDLGTLGGGFSLAADINDHNEVVGESTIARGVLATLHAFRWRDGVMTDLGTLGGPASAANAINNDGFIVGYAYLPMPPGQFPTIHAFLWKENVMHDLNDLISPDSGWMLIEANDVNNAGQIVGFGTFAGRLHGFILNPIGLPNPADLNGDGAVGGFDLALLLGAWGGCAVACPADLDGNGIVNGLDLAMLLAVWGGA